MDITKILTELRQDRAQIEEAVMSLERSAQSRAPQSQAPRPGRQPRGSRRNRMSPMRDRAELQVRDAQACRASIWPVGRGGRRRATAVRGDESIPRTAGPPSDLAATRAC